VCDYAIANKYAEKNRKVKQKMKVARVKGKPKIKRIMGKKKKERQGV
jgi:hypothetical protein